MCCQLLAAHCLPSRLRHERRWRIAWCPCLARSQMKKIPTSALSQAALPPSDAAWPRVRVITWSAFSVELPKRTVRGTRITSQLTCPCAVLREPSGGQKFQEQHSWSLTSCVVWSRRLLCLKQFFYRFWLSRYGSPRGPCWNF